MIMNQFKRAQVIMLPTNKIDLNTICLNNVTGLFLCTKQHLIQNVFNTLIEYKSAIPQHLYFISDDKIEENDYMYDPINKYIEKRNRLNFDKSYGWKKIIASTDKSLNLPQPSQQFVEKYIECYNKDEIITDVLVEYEDFFIKNSEIYINEDKVGGNYSTHNKQLKINPKDNTITIKKVKDNYSHEEVIKILNSFAEFCQKNDDNSYKLKEWIKENLLT